MCVPGQAPAAPVTAAEAVAMAQAGLGWLATAGAGSLTTDEQADCLRGLELAASMHTAARAHVLAAFHGQNGYADDGHGSAKTWLKWRTRITDGAAAGAMGWMQRLAAHPAVHDAMASGEISESWARRLCEWTDALPADRRADGDVLLLGAAAGGAELRDLAGLADEMRRLTAVPDDDGDDGFADRELRLDKTFRGAGKLDGDLTSRCTEALSAVLEALGKKAGPEDTRTKRQRDHDALEEACRRLVASGCLPGRAGQPTQILLHMDLDRLRGLPGAAAAEAAWAGAAAGPGEDRDATIVPIATGHVDPEVLDRLAAALLRPSGQPGAVGQTGAGAADDGADAARWQRAERAARRMVLAAAADLLSGPAGLAAYLRTRLLPGTVASVSLPLDVGSATETIPVHLRRAVTARDRHCRFPGCTRPAAVCQPHHIVPRSEGGPTSLTNLLLLCAFHHLVAVHRWDWGIALHPDGTVTATSPDRSRVLHSHGPPSQAA
jgi:Domain of unknown function (DUF222)/HNH endonuclease